MCDPVGATWVHLGLILVVIGRENSVTTVSLV